MLLKGFQLFLKQINFKENRRLCEICISKDLSFSTSTFAYLANYHFHIYTYTQIHSYIFCSKIILPRTYPRYF